MDQIEALKLLERRRDALLSLEGVTGAGVGEGPGGAVLHVFHDPPERADTLREDLRALLGDAPVELIAMPAAQGFSAD